MEERDRKFSKGWYWGVQEGQLTRFQAWMTFAVMFVFGFMSIYGLVRCGPVMPQVIEGYGFDFANSGFIQTFYTVPGVILAFPGAWIMRNFGIKRTIVISCIVSALGSLLGIIATDSVMVLASRLLEGVGAAFIMVIGPNVVTRLFPPNRLGFAMAIWALWAPVGIFIAMLVIPYLYTFFGLSSLWTLSTIVYAVCVVWLLISFKLPKANENELAIEKERAKAGATGAAKLGKPMILSAFVMAITFVTWSFVFGGCFNTFYPTYLQEVKHVSIYEASLWPSLISLFTIPLGILVGVLSDRIGTRKWFVTIPFFLMAALMAFAWRDTSDLTSVALVIGAMSIFSGAIPTASNAAIPEYAKTSKLTDYALAAKGCVSNVGSALVPLFSGTVAAAGWAAGGLWVLMPACLISGLLTLVLCKNDFRPRKDGGRLIADEVSDSA
jgi:MFS family permease